MNHPNICTIHEVGEHAGAPFLVMERLVGETLKRRLTRGALSLPEALDVAIPIADALDVAHRQHIVHRDLKPGNIFITDRGAAKLLDFGLAKVISAGSSGANTATHTVTPDATDAHAVVGTLAYMSPEQVRGQSLDARSDLFSFGAVLYELVTGVTPFGGDTTGVIIENILTRAPVTAGLLTASLPGELEMILAKAMEKDRELRYQSARELLVDLKRLKGSSSASLPSVVASSAGRTAGRPSRQRVGVALFAIGILAAGLAAWAARDRITSLWTADGPVTLELGQIRQVTSLPGLESQPTISPDGRMVAFVWQEQDNTDLWVKQVSGGAAFKVAPGPADDADPDWFPDGSTLVFRSGRRGGGIFTVPALGGDATRLASFGYRPRWSPDGRRVLFQVKPGGLLPNEVFVVDVPSGEPAKLLAYAAWRRPALFCGVVARWSARHVEVGCACTAGRPGVVFGGWASWRFSGMAGRPDAIGGICMGCRRPRAHSGERHTRLRPTRRAASSGRPIGATDDGRRRRG